GEPPARATTVSRPESDPETRGRVAVLWASHEGEPGWDPQTVGGLEKVDADNLAAGDDEYCDLVNHHLHSTVVKLNEEFTPLKTYAALRAREVGDEGVARAKDRYAVGIGVQMVLLDRLARGSAQHDRPVPSDWLDAARVSAARGVLAVLPDYD